MRVMLLCLCAAVFTAGCGSTGSTAAPQTPADGTPTARAGIHAVRPGGTSPSSNNGGAIVPGQTVPAAPPPMPQSVRVAPGPNLQDNAVLFGTVTDAATHSPLAGARVVVTTGAHASSATTGPFGGYSVKLPGGYFVSVNVTATGYVGQLSAGRVSAHRRFPLSFRLTRVIANQAVAPPPPAMFGSH
ncbi:MAG: hypothetical protein NVS2B16_31510 [Chloroflexota bacterium]